MPNLEQCICQNQNHGHEPGKCPNRATEANDLCKDCHAKAQELLETQKSFPDDSVF
jgi:cell division septum initiation protein DivIVA